MNEVHLEELSSPGCHNCAAFKEFWNKEKINWPNVIFKEISIMDMAGQELVRKHQIMASPGILLNGELFASGGINEEDFIKKLTLLSKK